MQRRLVPLLVAAVAVLAFAVAAGSLDTVATDGPDIEGSDEATGSVDRRAGGGDAGSGGDDEPDCQNCAEELSLRESLADALPTVPPAILLAAATIGCGLLALIARGGGERVGAASGSDGDPPAPPVPPTGGGPTASAYADPPPDRPIYRAWRETLGAIELARPASATPGERAAAARDRGWDDESVATLTDAFERARYGDGPADEAETERAREAADRLREER